MHVRFQIYSLHESQGPGQRRLMKTLGPLSDAYQSPGPQQLTCAVPLHTLGPAIPPSSCRHLQFIHVDHHYLLLELFSLSAASGQYRSFGTLSNCGVRRFTQSPVGFSLGPVGGVQGFPGRQIGSRRSWKGVLCGDGLEHSGPQGLLREW